MTDTNQERLGNTLWNIADQLRGAMDATNFRDYRLFILFLRYLLDPIMRPYQVHAVKQMVKCIEDDAGNGYVWHTTGSGKTLTSFKASTLLKLNEHIHKCLFVVDRKDLDRQTREDWSSSDKTLSEGKARRVSACSANQFNRFHEGCVEENTNTAALVRRLLSEDYADKVIVTTIQKLGLANQLFYNTEASASRQKAA